MTGGLQICAPTAAAQSPSDVWKPTACLTNKALSEWGSPWKQFSPCPHLHLHISGLIQNSYTEFSYLFESEKEAPSCWLSSPIHPTKPGAWGGLLSCDSPRTSYLPGQLESETEPGMKSHAFAGGMRASWCGMVTARPSARPGCCFKFQGSGSHWAQGSAGCLPGLFEAVLTCLCALNWPGGQPGGSFLTLAWQKQGIFSLLPFTLLRHLFKKK